MKKRYVNLILAMVSASAMALGSVPAMAATDSAKTESAQNDSKEDAEASNEKEADAAKTDTLEDGVYTAEFDTDSSMFHVNEANDEKGELTVKDGKMTICKPGFQEDRKSVCRNCRRCTEGWRRDH